MISQKSSFAFLSISLLMFSLTSFSTPKKNPLHTSFKKSKHGFTPKQELAMKVTAGIGLVGSAEALERYKKIYSGSANVLRASGVLIAVSPLLKEFGLDDKVFKIGMRLPAYAGVAKIVFNENIQKKISASIANKTLRKILNVTHEVDNTSNAVRSICDRNEKQRHCYGSCNKCVLSKTTVTIALCAFIVDPVIDWAIESFWHDTNEDCES